MSEKPNIVFIFSDQQRADTINSEVTPNLTELARDGADFTEAYTCQPVCGPARACLQTGMYATKNGCIENGIPMRETDVHIADLFNAAGYDYSAKLLISLNAEQVTLDDSPAYSEEIAQMVMKAIFEAYLSVTENILALSSSYADQIQTLLWRGSDLKSSQQDRADFDSMIQKCLGIQ